MLPQRKETHERSSCERPANINLRGALRASYGYDHNRLAEFGSGPRLCMASTSAKLGDLPEKVTAGGFDTGTEAK